MSTFQELCNSARPTLQDAPGVRYPDATEMIKYANVAIRVLRRFRRDLFYGTVYFTGPIPVFELDDPFPLADDYEPAMIDYLIARAESKNDEFGEDSKVLAFFQSAATQARG